MLISLEMVPECCLAHMACESRATSRVGRVLPSSDRHTVYWSLKAEEGS